ncbi:uncharacterized protein LOC107271117 [Cephus cinctus]|uniref:Uncharacterized protein LOC107271117 n=1 Tax=Cephus cinctus TaxID=211228 RepID=A0AAJ7C5Y4_CEPCN|nr:uncharacterized protein LOC107271117 [Cephus cinctus]
MINESRRDFQANEDMEHSGGLYNEKTLREIEMGPCKISIPHISTPPGLAEEVSIERNGIDFRISIATPPPALPSPLSFLMMLKCLILICCSDLHQVSEIHRT